MTQAGTLAFPFGSQTKCKVVFFTLILYLFAGQITSVNAYNLPEINPPIYSASSVVLMDANTGMILYESGGHDIMYPASITKIMTALIVLEQIEDLSERVFFSERAVYTTPRHTSNIAMNARETLSVYEALYGMMLESANEVSLALAEHVSGSIEAFVDLMNRRAISLGAYNTYFVNPSGLPGEGHVTTAYDFAIIMREAVRHPMFVDIRSTVRFDIPPTERQPLVRALLNTDRLIRSDPLFNESVVGGKTGFTSVAGHTLVTYARQGDRRLIVSVLGGSSPGTFTDTTALLDFGFAIPFVPMQIFDSAANTPSVPVYQHLDGVRRQVGLATLRAPEDIYFDLPADFDMSLLRYNLSVPQALVAPVQEGDDLGRVTIYVHGSRIGDAQLLAAESVHEYSPAVAAAYSSHQNSPEMYVAESGLSSGGQAYFPYEYYNGQFLPSWVDEYLLMLAVPLMISIVTLLVSLIVFFARRKSRSRRMLHARYARYPKYYRYR